MINFDETVVGIRVALKPDKCGDVDDECDDAKTSSTGGADLPTGELATRVGISVVDEIEESVLGDRHRLAAEVILE